MKILHLINLQGFGGAERLFIEYLKNSSFQNEVLCTSNSLNKNLIPELKHFDIKYANKIASTKIKYKTISALLAINQIWINFIQISIFI